MSAIASVIVAATPIMIQGIQTWMAMGRALGMTQEQIDAAYIASKARYDSKPPEKLPDA